MKTFAKKENVKGTTSDVSNGRQRDIIGYVCVHCKHLRLRFVHFAAILFKTLAERCTRWRLAVKKLQKIKKQSFELGRRDFFLLIKLERNHKIICYFSEL